MVEGYPVVVVLGTWSGTVLHTMGIQGIGSPCPTSSEPCPVTVPALCRALSRALSWDLAEDGLGISHCG